MVGACLASFAILAGGLATLYGLDWYKNRKQNRKLARKVGGKKIIIILKNHLLNN